MPTVRQKPFFSFSIFCPVCLQTLHGISAIRRHHLRHTNKASSLPFFVSGRHIFLVPAQPSQHGNFLRKSSQTTGSLRDDTRREQRWFPPILHFPLSKIILHRVIRTRTLSNFLQKESLYLYANKSLL